MVLSDVIKEVLVSMLGYSILNIRTASNDKDIKRVSCELEHLLKVLDLLKDVSLLKDYMLNEREKYLAKISKYQENPYEDLWNELQKIYEDEVPITLMLDEMDEVLVRVIVVGVSNISNFVDNENCKDIFIESYHIHNIPSIIVSKRKKEMINYYLKVERKQYVREGDKVARQNFERVWKELLNIVKTKKKFILKKSIDT